MEENYTCRKSILKEHRLEIMQKEPAINAPVQGAAADIIKIAMIEIDKWLMQKKSKTKIIMQVHDELVFEIHEDDINQEVKNIVNIMQDCVSLDLPLEGKLRN
jgi:DNA polymerase-1